MIDEYIKFSEYYKPSSGTIPSKRTDSDWHLLPLTKIIVSPPPLKTAYLDAAGQSGAYDLTAENGINFGNRTGKWQFKLMPGYNFDTIRYDMAQWLHGGYFRIDISTDTNCYYLGRVTIDEWKSTERGEYITIGYIIEPFRYDESTLVSTTKTIAPSDSSKNFTISLPLTRMKSVPIIEITGLTSGETLYISWAVPKIGARGTVGNQIPITSSTLQEFYDIISKKIVFYKGVSGEGDTRNNGQLSFTLTGQTSGMSNLVVKVDYIGGNI